MVIYIDTGELHIYEQVTKMIDRPNDVKIMSNILPDK